jgi:hypothetical protein
LGKFLEFLQEVEKISWWSSTFSRITKTDAVDAYHLCELFYKEELEPYKKRGIQLLNLLNLTRPQESIAEVAAKTKLQLHSLLDQVFPECSGVFGSLYSQGSLLTLLAFPTSAVEAFEKNFIESIFKNKLAKGSGVPLPFHYCYSLIQERYDS